MINCTVYKSFSKLDTTNKLDMSYSAEFGVMHLGTSNGVAEVGPADTGIKFYLSSPQYEFGEVDESDFIIQPA